MTRLLAVYDGSDNLLMRFEYADDRVPMAMTKAGAVYYLTYDQVGSLRAVVDGAGNVVKRIDYDSFGNILYDSNPGYAMPFGFAGGLHDRDTGLVRFGFRDYDPDIGRRTAKDPIFFAGGSSDFYGYCMNDPVNFQDPFGLALTDRQRLIVSVVGSIGAVVGSIAVGATTWGIGTPVGAAVRGALFSAAACCERTAAVMVGLASDVVLNGNEVPKTITDPAWEPVRIRVLAEVAPSSIQRRMF